MGRRIQAFKSLGFAVSRVSIAIVDLASECYKTNKSIGAFIKTIKPPRPVWWLRWLL